MAEREILCVMCKRTGPFFRESIFRNGRGLCDDCYGWIGRTGAEILNDPALAPWEIHQRRSAQSQIELELAESMLF